MKKSILAGIALAAVGTAGAAIVMLPDMTGAGTYTLDAGDSWVAAANTTIADQAVAVVNINGDWTSSVDYEVALGGVNYDASQDVTLNIGSAGSVTWGKAWIGDGPGGGGTIKIDIATGGTFSYVDGGGFLRWHPSGFSQVNESNLGTAWDEGILKRDGLTKADLTAGVDDAFAQNFSYTGSGNSFTLQAIPEPATLGLIGVFGGGMLFIRRRFMI